MNDKLNAPEWNLSSIFPTLKSKEYENYIAEYKSLMEQTRAHLESPLTNFSDWLKKYINLSNELSAHSKTLNAYAYLIYSVDTTNTDYLNNISRIEELLIEEDQLSLSFSTILKNNEEKVSDFFKTNSEFKPYEYLIKEELQSVKHQMSSQEEQLASLLQQTGGNAWDRLHEQIISNLKDSESGKTFNELRNEAYSPDSKIRFEAYKKEIELLKQNEIALAACLNNLKGETITLNKKRNFSTAIERALSSSRMSEKSLLALISAIEKSLPHWRNYFQAKACYLKKNNLTSSKSENPGLAFYDLFAPLSNDSEDDSSLLSKTWTFPEAIQYVIEKYYSFSKEMGDFAKYAYENNWIDAKIKTGKVGGAYDEDIPLGHQSRVMTNFTGAFSDVITLAHELGHAYHFYCMKDNPALFFDYPMTLAETASTFAETIVKQDIISKSTGNNLLQALEMDLQDVAQVLVDILCRFYFERSVFEKRAEGELNASDFCTIMKESQQKSYGDGLNDELHEYMWAVKSHYYSTDLDFYNFPYAFGQLFAMALYVQYKESGADFTKKYPKILKNTGNMSCEELCKRAELNIESEEFWTKAISIYTSEIKKFMELVK